MLRRMLPSVPQAPAQQWPPREPGVTACSVLQWGKASASKPADRHFRVWAGGTSVEWLKTPWWIAASIIC